MCARVLEAWDSVVCLTYSSLLGQLWWGYCPGYLWPYCRHYGHRDGVAPLANHPQRWRKRSFSPFLMILAPSHWESLHWLPSSLKGKATPWPWIPSLQRSAPTPVPHWSHATALSFAHSSPRLPGHLVQPVSPRSIGYRKAFVLSLPGPLFLQVSLYISSFYFIALASTWHGIISLLVCCLSFRTKM